MKRMWLVVAGFIVLTGYAVFWSGPVADHNSSMQHNEPTAGTVIETDIETRGSGDDAEFRPAVVYEYTVDGTSYQETNVYPGRFTRWHDSRSTAETVVEQYQDGSATKHDGTTVTVYYNPEQPGDAYLRNDGRPAGWWLSVSYIVVAFLAAGYLIMTGARRWRERQFIANTPTESIRALSIGPSEITGTVETDSESFRAPFSPQDCVIAKYEVEEYRETEDGGSWKPIASGGWQTPFRVDDGTGSVLVRPDDSATYEFNPESWATTTIRSSRDEPEYIRRFIQRTDGVSSGQTTDRRYKQAILQPGDDVYVFGTAQRRAESPATADNSERLVIQHVEGTVMREPMFFISDDEESALVDRRRFALWRFPAGIVLGTLGFIIFLLAVAPVVGIEVPRWFDGIIHTV